LHRTPAATAARAGARLLAALLPLAALGAVRLGGAALDPPLAWVPSAIAAVAATAAAGAFIATVLSWLRAGNLRDLVDAAGLGVLGTTFTLGALAVAGPEPQSLGLAMSGVAFAAASTVPGPSVTDRRVAYGALAGLFLLAEGALGLVLGVAPQLAGTGLAAVLFAGAGLAAAVGAATSLDRPLRATGLGISASASLVLAFAAGAWEPLVGVLSIAGAAVALGWSAVERGTTRDLPAALAPPIRLPTSAPAPELDDASRLIRELRGTLDELVAARRTVELQRAEIERVGRSDPLTGLDGRPTILERLRTEAAEARRYAHPLAIVLLDIDDFAVFNHVHGLAAGDELLREIALRLRLRTREADALGRLGGDAFLAILPHTDEGGAATFAEALRGQIVGRPLELSIGETRVSVSIGIALMRPGMELSDDGLLASVEEALASARAAGSNRIAFDRLHGLARLDERRAGRRGAADDASARPG